MLAPHHDEPQTPLSHPERKGPVFVVHECRTRPERHTEAATHFEHVLLFLVDGRLRIEHGATIDVDPGNVMLLPAGMPHRPLGGLDMEYWALCFCASCLRLDEGQPLMASFRRVRRGALPVVKIPEGRQSHLKAYYAELQAECERNCVESPELVLCWVRLILAEIHRATPTSDISAAAGSLVAEALEVIQRDCLKPISLEDVAAAVHRTPAHVADAVKKATGHSVGAWIGSGRIAEAAVRLLHTDDNLETIAEHIGWRDVTHFIRQFRKIHGVTPAVWRRERRRAHA